ncbi:hypothetical protein ACRAWD_29305 [Caulobacter segnis]
MTSHYLEAEVVTLPPEGPPATRTRAAEADAIVDHVRPLGTGAGRAAAAPVVGKAAPKAATWSG